MRKFTKVLEDLDTNTENWVLAVEKFGGNFEKMFKQVLDIWGYQSIDSKSLPKNFTSDLKKELLASDTKGTEVFRNKYLEYLPDNCYVHQPFDTQSFPDFLVIEDGVILPVEVKKTNAPAKPMLNSGNPVMKAVYIYCSLKRRDITTFLGESMVSYKELQEYKEVIALVSELLQEEADKICLKYNNQRGFTCRVRPAFDFRGSKANFFAHGGRKEFENDALKQVKSLSFVHALNVGV